MNTPVALTRTWQGDTSEGALEGQPHAADTCAAESPHRGRATERGLAAATPPPRRPKLRNSAVTEQYRRVAIPGVTFRSNDRRGNCAALGARGNDAGEGFHQPSPVARENRRAKFLSGGGTCADPSTILLPTSRSQQNKPADPIHIHPHQRGTPLHKSARAPLRHRPKPPPNLPWNTDESPRGRPAPGLSRPPVGAPKRVRPRVRPARDGECDDSPQQVGRGGRVGGKEGRERKERKEGRRTEKQAIKKGEREEKGRKIR